MMHKPRRRDLRVLRAMDDPVVSWTREFCMERVVGLDSRRTEGRLLFFSLDALGPGWREICCVRDAARDASESEGVSDKGETEPSDSKSFLSPGPSFSGAVSNVSSHN